MLVLMNSNQYCILVICYATKALHQYYPIQKLIPLTKTQKAPYLFALIIKEKERKNTENFTGIWASSTEVLSYIQEQFPQFQRQDFDT